MSKFLKSALITASSKLGLFGLARSATGHTIRILAYHGVEERSGFDNVDGFQVHPSVFCEHLEFISRHFRPVSLEDVIAFFTRGASLPPRAILVTFDDGYKNNIEIAAPLLSRYGVPAAFFITTGFIDRIATPWWYVFRNWLSRAGATAVGCAPNCPRRVKDPRVLLLEWETYLKSLAEEKRMAALKDLEGRLALPAEVGIEFMTWEDVRGLRNAGFAVGAHTVRHVNLGAEKPEIAEREITESIARIREKIGDCAAAFAYPYGRQSDFSGRLSSVLTQAGVRLGITAVHGLNRSNANPLFLKRVNVSSLHRGAAFEKLVSLAN